MGCSSHAAVFFSLVSFVSWVSLHFSVFLFLLLFFSFEVLPLFWLVGLSPTMFSSLLILYTIALQLSKKKKNDIVEDVFISCSSYMPKAHINDLFLINNLFFFNSLSKIPTKRLKRFVRGYP